MIMHPYFDHPGPIAFAHRGFSPDGLENSLTAFQAAVDLGFRYVETDVRATSDGVLVAFHDETLDRVTDMSGPIATLPWAAVRRARIGDQEPIPRLDDILGTWPDLRVNIDVKTLSGVAPLTNVIEHTRTHHRICIASFSDARRRAVVRRLSAPVATSAGRRSIAAVRFGASLARQMVAGIDCMQVPEWHGRLRIVTPRFIEAAHRLGKQVHVWTVNAADDMNRLLDMDVDGIVTDRADTLRNVLIARREWPAC